MSVTDKGVYIKTYGCQMNVYDSERMLELVSRLGYEEREDINDADLVILNTCHIREKATEKLYSELGRILRVKESRKERGEETILAVGGCVSQAEGERILTKASGVDIIFGPQSYHRLGELLVKREVVGGAVIDTQFYDKFAYLEEERKGQGVVSYVTIQEGCDKFCSFCVVPYTRGKEVSRSVSSIVRECEELLSKGAKSIVLLGQNVSAYKGLGDNGKLYNLSYLLKLISGLEGLIRLSYITSHPRDMDSELLRLYGELECLQGYLHLPVQSGSDRILSAMNRGYTSGEYLEIIAEVRSYREDIGISSDFIVGYTGEGEEEFMETYRLVEEVGFIQGYAFLYSSRAGTTAYLRERQEGISISKDEVLVKKERLHRLQKLLGRQQREYNERLVGKEVDILIEGRGKLSGQLVGRTSQQQVVHVDLEDIYIGRELSCIVERALGHTLSGKHVEDTR